MAKMLEITITGLPQVLANLDRFEKIVEKEIMEAENYLGMKIRDFARSNHPYKDRTGNLTHSINVDPAKKEGAFITTKIFAGQEYAPPVEFGTSRSRPYPFLFPALAAHETQAKQVMKGAVERAAKAIQVRGV